MRYGAKVTIAAVLVLLVSLTVFSQDEEVQPPVIQSLDGDIPSDAIVLFDGSDLSEWTNTEGGPSQWKVEDGTMTVNRGGLLSKREFGDLQVHLEFAMPSPPRGEGQDRGNSGIYFHGAYEVQILDSYGSKTYSNGQCGAIYEQYPPLVNVCRPPGVWQKYDIVFRAPKFDANGKRTKMGTFTVFHNGVLIQDNVDILGTTRAAIRTTEQARGPIFLQDHGHPVKYRSIWVREL